MIGSDPTALLIVSGSISTPLRKVLDRSRCRPSPDPQNFRPSCPELIFSTIRRFRLSRSLLRAFEYYDGSVPIQVISRADACLGHPVITKAGDTMWLGAPFVHLPLRWRMRRMGWLSRYRGWRTSTPCPLSIRCAVSVVLRHRSGCRPLQTRVQAIQLSPYTSCPDPPHRKRL